jgi:hypothetical protein
VSWGDPFRRAWDAATDTGRRAASAIAEKGRQAAGWVKDKAVEAATWADTKARETVRGVERRMADGVYDGAAAGAEGVRRSGGAVRDAYGKVKDVFTGKPAGSPVTPCPGSTDDGTKDPARDGWLMAPQGPGRPCVAIPPGKAALATARSRAAVSNSPCCEKRRAGEPPRDIIYVNGINTTAKTHCETLNEIAAQSCGRVVGVYNATEGGTLDAAQTGQDRRLIKAADSGKAVRAGDGRNPAVDTLSKEVRRELRAGRQPEIWAHSQGGAVTSLALYDARNARAAATLDPDPLKGMKVKSFGAAAPSWPDGPDYQHFVHVNDPVPSVFGLGHADVGDSENAGRVAEVIRFSGKPGGPGPFTTKNRLDYVPSNIGNHDVSTSYLAMEKQVNGGCP